LIAVECSKRKLYVFDRAGKPTGHGQCPVKGVHIDKLEKQ